MDANNLRVLVNLSGGYGDRLRQGLDAIAKSPHQDRMVLFANINFAGRRHARLGAEGRGPARGRHQGRRAAG